MNYVAVLVGDAGGIGAEMRDLARWSVPDELIEQGASEEISFACALFHQSILVLVYAFALSGIDGNAGSRAAVNAGSVIALAKWICRASERPALPWVFQKRLRHTWMMSKHSSYDLAQLARAGRQIKR